MIVPRLQLLVWVGCVGVPCAALVGLGGPLGAVALLILLGFVLVTLVDAGLAWRSVEELTVTLPAVWRGSKDRESTLELVVQHTGTRARSLRLGLPWPPSLAVPYHELDVHTPAGTPRAVVAWPLTPRRRGRYVLGPVYVEGHSPLGWWAARRRQEATCELRVYPNLGRERQQLAAIFLRRGMQGVHAQRQVGKGRDFEKLRPYTAGDGFEDIHWKATAKRGYPVTKVFQIERTQEVYVILDSSRLSGRLTPTSVPDPATAGTAGQPLPVNHLPEDASELQGATELERYVTAALVLGLVAQKQGDLFGVIAFNDRVRQFVRARGGPAHYQACRDALYTLHPTRVSPDFNEVCSLIRLRLRRRALLVFLTNLDDPLLAETFARNVELICRQHLVVVGMLRPPAAQPLFGPAPVATLDDIYHQLAGHLRWHGLRDQERSLARRGVNFALLDHEKLCPELVGHYLAIKQRQLL